MNQKPDLSEDKLAEAYRGWARRQLGDPPPFRAPRPSVPASRQWHWVCPVSLAGALAAIAIVLMTPSQPSTLSTLALEEWEPFPWPSETDFLLQRPDPTLVPYLIIEP